MKIKSLTVFCGSKSGNNPSFLKAATHLGNLLAQEKIELVYGGGNKGLMGAVANGCLANGGNAELCGLYHAYMETTGEVMSSTDFNNWVIAQGGHTA